MKVTSVSVRYSKTVQVARFEPVRVELEATATVGPEEAAGEVIDLLHGNLRAQTQRLITLDIESPLK